MTASKQDAVDMLFELAELTKLDEGSPQSFRVRAYENAAHAIEAHPADLGTMSVAELSAIEHVGRGSARKIRELLDTGRVEKLEALRERHPPGVVALLGVPGLGPKGVQRLRSELGVTSVDELRAAIAEGRVRSLSGFGVKSEQRIAEALSRLEAEGALGRMPIAAALPVASRFAARLREVDGVVDVTVAGSLRRFKETIGDVDIVVVADTPAPVMEAVVGMSAVDRVVARGDAKTSVVTAKGLQVDVRVVRADQGGAALVYFTGSKAHNIHLRKRALARGWTLNEYALTDTENGRVVAGKTEADIYEALDLPWIPPVLREDTGEIEAGATDSLPARLGPAVGDFHVHTTVSGDGRSTLEAMAKGALEHGLRVLAVTDHAAGTVSGASREALLEQREHLRALQDELGDELTLLHGVELNIGPEGELDYDAELRSSFDWCVASIHDHFALGKDAQTARVLRAMADPSVRMVGHLACRMIGRRPAIDLDLEAVLDAAATHGVALEVNGGLPRLDLPVDWLRVVRGRDVPLLLTSDAHHHEELQRLEYARLHASRAWIEPPQVPNTWSVDRLLAWVSGGRRPPKDLVTGN